MKMPIRCAASIAVCGLVLVPNLGNVHASSAAKDPTWITTKGKVVTLTVIAAYKNVAAGFNFNGYAKGKMTITVPTGDTVNVVFSNATSITHSAQIIAAPKKGTPVQGPGSVADAFKGASSPDPKDGVTKGVTQKFSFLATKAGNYQLICAVPGHLVAGMWDNFVVSSKVKTGTITISK